jgi:hypothetical protein
MHRPTRRRMNLRCLLLVAGSINAFALVQQSPSLNLGLSRRTAASGRTYTSTSKHTYGYPRRLPRTSVLQESSDDSSSQDVSDSYLLDSPQESNNSNTNINTNNGDTQPSFQPPLPQQPFARNEQWLEDATDDFLDEQIYPTGSLAEDDLESINALMVAWSRRRSTEAALTVEKLLKRVVDDMHAGNERVHVHTRMYTHVSDESPESCVVTSRTSMECSANENNVLMLRACCIYCTILTLFNNPVFDFVVLSIVSYYILSFRLLTPGPRAEQRGQRIGPSIYTTPWCNNTLKPGMNSLLRPWSVITAS